MGCCHARVRRLDPLHIQGASRPLAVLGRWAAGNLAAGCGGNSLHES